MKITFISTSHPQLRVAGVGRFTAGKIAVEKSDTEALRRLRGLTRMGVFEQPAGGGPVVHDRPTGPTESAVISAPSRSASRAAWAEFAATQGVDVEGLRRDEIIEALGV